jgi:F-type H+-transporting ATPase subunit gamma
MKLEVVRRQIEAATQLRAVVKTMGALAAVQIHQCEEAVASLAWYRGAVEQGLQVVLQRAPALWRGSRLARTRRATVVAFGTDQGMCGGFNEAVLAAAQRVGADLDARGVQATFLAVGERLGALLHPDSAPGGGPTLEGPGSVGGMGRVVAALLEVLERQVGEDIDLGVVLCRHSFEDGGATAPAAHPVLPLDRDWLRAVAQRPWPGPSLPTFHVEPEPLLRALVREYLVVALTQACAESFAAENSTRLAAMRRAERNIDDRLDALQQAHHTVRQESITSEILDIVAGAEAARPRRSRKARTAGALGV